MAINTEKMKRSVKDRAGDNTWKPIEGDNMIYVAGTFERGMDEYWDGTGYVEVKVHYALNNSNAWAVCLDTDSNPVLNDPWVKGYLKERGIKIKDGRHCPRCNHIRRDGLWENDKELAKKISASSRYLWIVVPWAHRQDASMAWMEGNKDRVQLWTGPYGVWNDICDIVFEEGDITHIDKASLIIINRDGKGITTTYKVKADRATLNDPIKLSKPTRALLKKMMVPKTEIDPFFWVASKCIDAEEMEAMISGAVADDEVESESDGTADGGQPACFGDGFEKDDPDCIKCPFAVDCIPICAEKGIPDAVDMLASVDAGQTTTTTSDASESRDTKPKSKPKQKPKPESEPEPEPEPEPDVEDDETTAQDDDGSDDESGGDDGGDPMAELRARLKKRSGKK